MTKQRAILILLFTLLSIFVEGQTDTTKKKFEYEICVYHNPKEKPKLVVNKVIGTADTIVSFISGRIYNYKKDPLSYAIILFINSKDSSISLVDSLGNFNIYLSPGNYKLSTFYVGYNKFQNDSFEIISGQLRQIEIDLGHTVGFQTWSISSDKPLSKRKLKRIEKQLKRGD